MRAAIVGAVLAAVTAFGPVAAVDAASTADVTITVTIQSLSVAITSNAAWAIGTVNAGATVTQSAAQRAVVQNDGNISEKFTLRISNAGGTWAISPDATAGADEFVMSGVFGATGDAILAAHVNESTGSEDVVTGSAAAGTATVYGSSASTQNGAAVPATNSRGLWLQFKAPTSSSTTSQQSIVTTIGVEAS